jgi:hypothetical protein
MKKIKIKQAGRFWNRKERKVEKEDSLKAIEPLTHISTGLSNIPLLTWTIQFKICCSAEECYFVATHTHTHKELAKLVLVYMTDRYTLLLPNIKVKF